MDGASKPLKPFQGLKLHLPTPMQAIVCSFKASKTLSGIETVDRGLGIPVPRSFKASKTLSGIETFFEGV